MCNPWQVRDELTITRIEGEWCRVYIQRDYDPRNVSVMVGNHRLGRPYPNMVYEGSVTILYITLSDGQTYQVASREIEAYEPRGDRDRTYYDHRRVCRPQHTARKIIQAPRRLTYQWKNIVVWNTYDTVHHSPHHKGHVEFYLDPVLSWEIAQYLQEGTVFAEYREYPQER